jgi:hypothetical protein
MPEVQAMLGYGEAVKESIRPDFDKSIFMHFTIAKITSDAGFLLMRVIGQRFGVIQSECNNLTACIRSFVSPDRWAVLPRS